MDNRDYKYGRLLAVADVLHYYCFYEHVSDEILPIFRSEPLTLFKRLYEELKRNEVKTIRIKETMERLQKYLNDMGDDFSNEPLSPGFIKYFEQERDNLLRLGEIIGVAEAAEILGLSPGSVKTMCQNDKIPCKKLGYTWALNYKTVMDIKRMREMS